MTLPRFFTRYPALTIGLLTVILTAVIGITVITIQSRYFEHYPYFFDHVSYSYFSIRVYERSVREGRLQVAQEEWFSNGRNPLRTAPLVLLAPELLRVQFGYLATSLPFVSVFIGLLGLFVHRRTGSLPYALACMCLFIALPGLLDPRIGLGAYWLETAAAPLLGSALLCLLQSDGTRHIGWLAGFAAFAALACLSRYVTIAFVVALYAPIIGLWLVLRLWKERDVIRSLVLPVIVMGVVGGVLAGPFLYKHTAGNITFYSSLGPVGQGQWNALIFTTQWVSTLMGLPVIGVLLVAASVVTILAVRINSLSWSTLALSVWLAGALFALLTIQGAAEAAHVVWFVIPPLFIALVAPLPIRRLTGEVDSRNTRDNESTIRMDYPLTDRAGNSATTSENSEKPGESEAHITSQTRIPLLILSVAIGAFAVGTFGWNVARAWAAASNPPAIVASQKTFDVELARVLAGQGPGLVWNAYFDEYAWIPTLEAYYRYGVLILPAGQPFYHHHAPHWAFEFPGYSPDALGKRVAEGTTRLVDVAVVFDNPADADTNAWMTNPHSRAVARMAAEEVQSSSSWRRIATIESMQYGRLAVYRNSTTKGMGFEQALHNRLWP